MVLLNNKWEELRSALEYYHYVSISDEEGVVYQTGAVLCPLVADERYGSWSRIQLKRDLFHTRNIYINNGIVRRISAADDSGDVETFEIITEDKEKITLSLWGRQVSPEELIQLNGKITVDDMVNPKVWNKDMCFYNSDTDTAAIGIDVFNFNLRSAYKSRKRNGTIQYVDGIKAFTKLFTTKINNRNNLLFMGETDSKDNYIPAIIVENNSGIGNNIYLDVINSYTGERLTYKQVALKLNEAKIKEIHSFVAEMKAAYNFLFLLETSRDY